MPFDFATFPSRELELLDGAFTLIGAKERWCKQQLRSYDGRRCILGALMAASRSSADTQRVRDVVLTAIKQETGRDYLRIEMFNDHPLTTHADVMRVMERARKNLIGGIAIAPQPVPAAKTPALIARLKRALALA